MNKKIAKRLVDSLEKHSGIVTPDKNLFFEVLVSTEIPTSSSFYEAVPENQQLVQEVNRYHYLSLRRILRNRNAKNYQLSHRDRIYESVASAFGIHSSDALIRNLRADTNLIKMMSECIEPFSLWGKLQTYDFDNPDETLFVVTRPVLIIPDVKDNKPILDWEKTNTTYKEEVGLFFRRFKKIKLQEYLSY